MKIRIKGNSIRLRLSKSEVENLSKANAITEVVEIGNDKLIYEVCSADVEYLEASFIDHVISVRLPAHFASTWMTSDEVGIQYIQKNDNGSELFLLIEKDFVCLDRTFEDQSDNFPNPSGEC